jgi:hypothetical protein
MSIATFIKTQENHKKRIRQVRTHALCDCDGFYFIFKAEQFDTFKAALSLQEATMEYPIIPRQDIQFLKDKRLSFAFNRLFVAKKIKPEFFMGLIIDEDRIIPAPVLIQRSAKYFSVLIPLANENEAEPMDDIE